MFREKILNYDLSLCIFMKNKPFKISIIKEIFDFFLLSISSSFNNTFYKTVLLSQETKNEGKHINAIVNEFEVSILTDLTVKKLENNFEILSGSSKLKSFLNKLLNQNILKKQNYFAVLMGPDFQKLQPFNLMASQLDVYMFDAWPPDYFPHIKEHMEKLKIRNIFFSSKQVADIFSNNKIQNCYWIPEAVDYKKYHFLDYEKKDIDILQFGRRCEWIHENLLNNLNSSSIRYLYSDDKIFNSDLEFKDGLARAKISLCFPASFTHPEKAGGISTMTTRYLQSMASKCLVVGKMPEEMKELFDYLPVIDLNLNDPFMHLKNILENFNEYIPLIEKNYLSISQKHTWVNRWESIKNYL
jgi:hypothetical protein